MSRMLSEQTVKKRLEINSFRELTKDKVIRLASMIDRMDPEVAKKALDQFPDFADTNKEILVDYKEILNSALEQNEKSTEHYYDACKLIINTLQEQLEKEDLSFEDKKYIITEMKDVAIMMGDKNTEDKRFLLAMAALGFGTITLIGGALASILGGNIKITSGDSNDYEEEGDYE